MGALREIVLRGKFKERSGGAYKRVDGVAERDIADIAARVKLSRPLKVIAACGNGTAGAFAPERCLEAHTGRS